MCKLSLILSLKEKTVHESMSRYGTIDGDKEGDRKDIIEK